MNDLSPNFSSILDDAAPDHVELPKPLPVGSYLCSVPLCEYGASRDKGTKYVQWDLPIIAPLDDVDPDALEAYGDVKGRTIRATFYYADADDNISKSSWRLDAFHEHCGLNLRQPSSWRKRNDAVTNSQVVVYVRHEPEKLSREDLAAGVVPRVFSRLDRTAPAD